MRLLIATDAWLPQINGVVRCIAMWAQAAEQMGVTIVLLTSDGLLKFPLPTYPTIKLAFPRREFIRDVIKSAQPDAIHIATEGPIGYAVRRHCLEERRSFSTYFHSRFPDYVAARVTFPKRWIWSYLQHFHGPARVTMVGTAALADELLMRGFSNAVVVAPGVDAKFFHPGLRTELKVDRPIFLHVGRLAPEKDVGAFLRLNLPGSKLVIGDGPLKNSLVRQFPRAQFFGAVTDKELAKLYASADVFVFPSRTDTFGLVMLEALASGLPIAAHVAQAPIDLVQNAGVGILDKHLDVACLNAIHVSRSACRTAALSRTWENSAHRFLQHAMS